MTRHALTEREAASTTAPRGTFWSGWVVFASLMLVLIGTWNAITGVVALLRETYFVVNEGSLVVFNFYVWGIILLCFGGIMILTGLGLTSGREWARTVAIVLALVNVVAHLAFLAAYPAWSVIIIAIDVLVIFALTARWRDVQSRLEAAAPPNGDGRTPAGREAQPPVPGSTP